jgi:addiction module HigA family antidote
MAGTVGINDQFRSVSGGNRTAHMKLRLWTITNERKWQMSIQRSSTGWNTQRKPVHTEEMLREEFMVPLALSANRLAIELRVPVTRVSEIANERRGISADTALRLERYFGMSAEFWLGLQKDFDLHTARQMEGKKIVKDVRPRSNKAA